MRLLVSSVFLALMVAGPAWGKGSKGYTFYEYCREKDQPCAMYGMGYIHGFKAGVHLSKEICLQGVSNWQVSDVVIKYLEAHPETRHEILAVLSLKAIAEAFPCKE